MISVKGTNALSLRGGEAVVLRMAWVNDTPVCLPSRLMRSLQGVTGAVFDDFPADFHDGAGEAAQQSGREHNRASRRI